MKTFTHEDQKYDLWEACDKHRELIKLERLLTLKLFDAEQKATSIGHGNISGMPHGTTTKRSRIEDNAIKIADIEGKLKEVQIEMISLQKCIIHHLCNIKDVNVRCLIDMRYLIGLSYDEIADEMREGKDGESYKKYLLKLRKTWDPNTNIIPKWSQGIRHRIRRG